MPKNIFYAQSGGPTTVINATACALIEAARAYPDYFGKVYAGVNGILGALQEELIDTSFESAEDIEALKYTPASAFGSCRYKLKNFEQDPSEYERLIEVFRAHDIGYFFYNGGGDSQDTTLKISKVAQKLNYPLVCIGLPKTIDNDLPGTHCSPGFGSVAKYVAISTHEASLDVMAMAATSTKVFILEVMGRHAGWIAAASGLIAAEADDPPQIILFPEVAFDQPRFLAKVQEVVERIGYCVIVVSEGIRHTDGSFLTDSGLMKDAFGHVQLGGVAPILAHLIKRHLGYKYHWALADYLQRSARHISSQTDFDHACAIGKAAIEYVLAGKRDVMLTIEAREGSKNNWAIGTIPLAEVANREVKLPRHYIAADGMHITEECKNYLRPLIHGESYPPYNQGLPQYIRLKNHRVPKKLLDFTI